MESGQKKEYMQCWGCMEGVRCQVTGLSEFEFLTGALQAHTWDEEEGR